MSKLDEITQAAIALSNYDAQQKEFSRITKGIVDPRAKEIYSKLENRLRSVIMDYARSNPDLQRQLAEEEKCS